MQRSESTLPLVFSVLEPLPNKVPTTVPLDPTGLILLPVIKRPKPATIPSEHVTKSAVIHRCSKGNGTPMGFAKSIIEVFACEGKAEPSSQIAAEYVSLDFAW